MKDYDQLQIENLPTADIGIHRQQDSVTTKLKKPLKNKMNNIENEEMQLNKHKMYKA